MIVITNETKIGNKTHPIMDFTGFIYRFANTSRYNPDVYDFETNLRNANTQGNGQVIEPKLAFRYQSMDCVCNVPFLPTVLELFQSITPIINNYLFRIEPISITNHYNQLKELGLNKLKW